MLHGRADHRADVVLLAGGAGRRYAAQAPGADKLSARLADTTVIGRLAGELQRSARIFVVGHPLAARAAGPTVTRLQEDPPGGGPLPALAAGLAAASTPAVVVLAGDQPFAASAVPRLLAALRARRGALAAVGVDAGGRRQPLLSAWRREPVLAVLGELAAQEPLAGRPLRALLARVEVVEVAVTDAECLDVDVPADLERARELLGRAGPGGET
ncbi:NTP transferase domain-containing protein [Kineococcus sp. SYSU DK006]|uniref:NTP transferase domain-containing protein n=1 Tax=Kineococcus sp. SYSU DK006 TaxID=3383127 RepID=UPI003D7EC997